MASGWASENVELRMYCNPNCDWWPWCHIRQIHPVPWYDPCWHLFWIVSKDHFTWQWKNYEVMSLKEVMSTILDIMGCRYLSFVFRLEEPIWHNKTGCATMADSRRNKCMRMMRGRMDVPLRLIQQRMCVNNAWKNGRAMKNHTPCYQQIMLPPLKQNFEILKCL